MSNVRVLTRSFDNMPSTVLEYNIYAISTTRPQKYRKIPILWLFSPTFDIQIEYNISKDFKNFDERMASVFKQRASAIEDWVKANSDSKICLVCWEGLDFCHRRLAAEVIKHAAGKSGISITVDIG